MKTKPRQRGLSLQRHKELGHKIKAARTALLEVAVLIPSIYGSSSRVGVLAGRPLHHLDVLRCELDDQVFRDHPQLVDDSLSKIYYGPNKDATGRTLVTDAANFKVWHGDERGVWRTGPAAMMAWDKTWREYHLPMWAKKARRLNAIRKGEWRKPSGISEYVIDSAEWHLPPTLFDHWGSVVRGEVRALLAQPYGQRDGLAEQFALELGLSITRITPAPWHPAAWGYEFQPSKEAAQ